MSIRYVEPGERVRMEVGYSEAAMHLRIAGQTLEVEITTGQYPMAQIWKDGKPYSFPITLGEAGVYTTSDGRYYVPVPFEAGF